MIRTSIVILLFAAALLISTTAFAAPLDKIQFLKISPKDEKAVIKGADGKLQVIKPGDTVVDNVTVKEIALGRIVLEEKTATGPETVIVRMVNDKARIERLSRTPERTPLLMAPATNER